LFLIGTQYNNTSWYSDFFKNGKAWQSNSQKEKYKSLIKNRNNVNYNKLPKKRPKSFFFFFFNLTLLVTTDAQLKFWFLLLVLTKMKTKMTKMKTNVKEVTKQSLVNFWIKNFLEEKPEQKQVVWFHALLSGNKQSG
jgi:hypothetical protein